MMSRRLHPLSVATGIAIAVLLFGISSFGNRNTVGGDLRVSLDPDPAAIVRITEAQPFQVPAHRILVLKAFLHTGFVNELRLLINNTPVCTFGGGAGPTPEDPLVLGFPITAQPGDVVSVAHGQFDDGEVTASGYLADL